MSLHSIADGKITSYSSKYENSTKMGIAHKAIFDVHAPFVGFIGGHDIEVSYKRRNGKLQHHMRHIQAPTDPSASPERYHVRGHTTEIIWASRGTFEPSFGEECVGRGKDRRVSMHGPGLSSNNRSWWKCISHEVEDLI
jgi:hypothetical protein